MDDGATNSPGSDSGSVSTFTGHILPMTRFLRDDELDNDPHSSSTDGAQRRGSGPYDVVDPIADSTGSRTENIAQCMSSAKSTQNEELWRQHHRSSAPCIFYLYTTICAKGHEAIATLIIRVIEIPWTAEGCVRTPTIEWF